MFLLAEPDTSPDNQMYIKPMIIGGNVQVLEATG